MLQTYWLGPGHGFLVVAKDLGLDASMVSSDMPALEFQLTVTFRNHAVTKFCHHGRLTENQIILACYEINL